MFSNFQYNKKIQNNGKNSKDGMSSSSKEKPRIDLISFHLILSDERAPAI